MVEVSFVTLWKHWLMPRYVLKKIHTGETSVSGENTKELKKKTDIHI